MQKPHAPLTRRQFLRFSAAGLGALALAPAARFSPPALKQAQLPPPLPEFPAAERLGRIANGKWEIMSRPDPDSKIIKVVYEDAVFPWLREVVGEKMMVMFNNQRWVETPDGFIYAPYVQPVRNQPNQPLLTLPQDSLGPGLWVEVSVPYVDIALEREASSHSWISARQEKGLPLRIYYGQVFWIDTIKTDDQGNTFYRINPNYYGGVDMFWADARALRPIPQEELAPISPEVENKRVVVDVTHQTMSCYEGEREVYFCRVSTGAKFDMYGNVVDKWATPVGTHRISRKFISLQMSGGATGAGYDLPGIGWTSIFATGGVAIHATVWHNNFGDPMSHGCVNSTPTDSHWVFRWTNPTVTFDPGMLDVTVNGGVGTQVKVIEG